jgi:hypothetical protein
VISVTAYVDGRNRIRPYKHWVPHSIACFLRLSGLAMLPLDSLI